MLPSYVPLLLSVLASSGSAAEEITASEQNLEPCINGAVSATGMFPTQATEEQVNAHLAWSAKTGLP
jgi:hypothetical protein